VRADSNSEAVSNVDENPEASDNADEVSETEGEQVLDSASEVEEAKPPRQTRVKLGDVMGVSYFFHDSILLLMIKLKFE
jgi:hypothetical protein